MAMPVMAQQIKTNNANSKSASCVSGQRHDEAVKPMFHDFLGTKSTTDLAAVSAGGDGRLSEASPSASLSVGASSGGGRGPISSTSDLGSERQVGNHLEGVPLCGARSDISGPETSKRLAGNKRSNSESTFMGSPGDGTRRVASESFENSHLLKILRDGAGGEQPKRSNDDEVFFGARSLRPTATSLVVQPHTGSKWERTIPMKTGAAVHYRPHGVQFAPLVHQVPVNRFRDASAGPSVISQAAADEGSRTGIKGPGILSSLNVSGSVSERNSSAVLPCGNRPKSGIHLVEPESSILASRHGLASTSRQMTIFYGGQAHVFDDVHPNKADIIMALAGSNGGSWSTTYSPKSSVRPPEESYMPSGDKKKGTSNMVFPRDFRGRLSIAGNSSPSGGSAAHQSSITAKDARNPVPTTHGTEDQREA